MEPHQVHQDDALKVERTKVRTYDPELAGGREPDGEDVTPGGTRWTPDGDGLRSEPIDEVRTPWWELDETSRTYVGALTCPDCGRGVRSRGDRGMACIRLELDEPLDACHPGCLVACGGDDD